MQRHITSISLISHFLTEEFKLKTDLPYTGIHIPLKKTNSSLNKQ